jgi:hypothetical protein
MRRSISVLTALAVTLTMPVAQAAAKPPSLTHKAAMEYSHDVYFPGLIKVIEDPAKPFVDGHVTKFTSGTFTCSRVSNHRTAKCPFTMKFRATSSQNATDVVGFTCHGAVTVGYGLLGSHRNQLGGRLDTFDCGLDGGSGTSAGPPAPGGAPAPPGGTPPPPPGS